MLNSAEISGMIGQQQMMFAQQQAFAQQIGAGFAMAPPGFGMLGGFGAPGRVGEMATERLAGSALNPVFGAMQGTGSMLGMAGTMLGTFGGPAGMVAGIGLQAGGAVLGATAGMMGQGVQQQLFLNDTMRQNYNFMGAGRQGFNRSDVTRIGSVMGDMVHQVGPMGERSSFDELSRVAGKLGQMGMMNGVRDVQQFTARFKETINTLKTMAQDLGTTLEGALEFSKAQQSSGFFQNADKLRATQLARQMALSGNMSLTEMSAAGQIGSQIARSMGGLGKQGAIGGMRALGTVGTATQLGVMSNEDIYNATGLDGAEGRQAMATRMMQIDAQFFRSAKGRWMLASMAGKDGTLDMDVVDRIKNGEMTVGDTRGAAGEHLGKVGRANFIRNEGKLRSAAMEQFAGMGAALQMRQWAEGKGIDLFNEKDDRAAIWAGRQFGTSADETDAIMKMARDLPQIMKEQQRAGRLDKQLKADAERRSNMGLAGVKKRIDSVTHAVKERFEEAGRTMMNDASNWVDDTINDLMGTYESHMTDTAAKLSDMVGGGAAVRGGHFGVSAEQANKFSKITGKDAASFMGDGGFKRGAAGSYDMFMGNALDERRKLLGQFGGERALFVEAGARGAVDPISAISRMLRTNNKDRFVEAGYDMSGVNDDASLGKKLDEIDRMRAAARGSDYDEEFKAYGKREGEILSDRYLSKGSEGIRGEGEERLRAFGKTITDPRLREKYENASSEEKARMMNSAEEGAGVKKEHRIGEHMKSPDTVIQRRLSEKEYKEQVTSGFGVENPFAKRESATNVISNVGFDIARLLRGKTEQGKANAYLNSDEAKQLAMGLVSSNQDEVQAARDKLRSDMEGSEGVVNEMQNRMLTASKYAEAKARGAKTEELEKIADAGGMSVEDADKAASTLVMMSQQQRLANGEKSRQIMAKEGKEAYDQMTKKGGVVTVGKDGKTLTISAEGKKSLAGIQGGEEIMLAAAKLAQDRSKLGEGDSEGQKKAWDAEEALLKKVSGMTVEQQRKMAARLEEQGDSRMARGIRDQSDTMAQLNKARGSKDKGVQQMMAGILGADSKAVKEGVGDLDLSNDDGVRAFLKRDGLENNKELAKDIRDAVRAQKAGKTAEAATLMRKAEAERASAIQTKTEAEKKKTEDGGKEAKASDKGTEKVVSGLTDMKGAIVGKLGEVVSAINSKNAERKP